MGWGASVVPLSFFDTVEDWAWLTEVVVGPMPTVPPAGTPPPTVSHVLHVLRDAGFQGDAWFTLDERESSAMFAAVPADEPRPEFDMGGVSLHLLGAKAPEATPAEIDAAYERPLPADGLVEAILFSKPHPRAVLRAACAMSAVWGQVVAMEDSGCVSVIVSPSDTLGEHVRTHTVGDMNGPVNAIYPPGHPRKRTRCGR